MSLSRRVNNKKRVVISNGVVAIITIDTHHHHHHQVNRINSNNVITVTMEMHLGRIVKKWCQVSAANCLLIPLVVLF